MLNSTRTVSRGLQATSVSSSQALPARGQVRYPHNLPELKRRINSVKSVQKITRAMNMVASSKLRKAEQTAARSAPYYYSLFKVASGVEARDEAAETVVVEGEAAKIKRTLVVPITADRGLCGSSNSTVLKATRKVIGALKASGQEYNLICLGDKGQQSLGREQPERIIFSASNMQKKMTFLEVSLIAERIVEAAQEYDNLIVLHNHYVNLLRFDTVEKKFIGRTTFSDTETRYERFIEYAFEDDLFEEALDDLYSFSLASLLYHGLIDSTATELAQRMTSMDNATKNASDMASMLTLFYNKQRQSNVTTDLIEIVSGMRAVIASRGDS